MSALSRAKVTRLRVAALKAALLALLLMFAEVAARGSELAQWVGRLFR